MLFIIYFSQLIGHKDLSCQLLTIINDVASSFLMVVFYSTIQMYHNTFNQFLLNLMLLTTKMSITEPMSQSYCKDFIR